MRSILLWAALGGLGCGALTAALPASAVKNSVWQQDRYSPSYPGPKPPAPVVKISSKRLPSPKIERIAEVPEAEIYADVDERAEAHAAAIRYALAHQTQITSSGPLSD